MINCSECDEEDAMEFEMIDTVLAVLEIGKFDGPGLTPRYTPPSSEVVVLSDISSASFRAQSKRPS